MALRVGIAGWTYGPWRGTFYPEDLKQKEELAYASRQVNSIEINGSFYSLQQPGSYERWYEATPEDFVFSVKAPRYITHIRRLREVEGAVANFFASGVLALAEKLGPILWQFPPSLKFDAERFEEFFKMLPGDTEEAARVAEKHEKFMKGRVYLKSDGKRVVRHAVEVRHESFKTAEFIELLRKYGLALVVADTAGKWPLMEDVTADFVYLRLHGDEELYISGYTDRALAEWARKVRAWARGAEPAGAKRVDKKSGHVKKGRDVYVYFDNDVKVRAPVDAQELARRLGLRDRPMEMEG